MKSFTLLLSMMATAVLGADGAKWSRVELAYADMKAFD